MALDQDTGAGWGTGAVQDIAAEGMTAGDKEAAGHMVAAAADHNRLADSPAAVASAAVASVAVASVVEMLTARKQPRGQRAAVHTLAEWATGVALALSVQGSVRPSCRKVYRPAT